MVAGMFNHWTGPALHVTVKYSVTKDKQITDVKTATSVSNLFVGEFYEDGITTFTTL